MQKLLLALVVASCGCWLDAATVYSIRGCDNGHSKLGEASYNGNYYWDDHGSPSAGNDYVSRHFLRSMPTLNHDHTFGGNSLTVEAGGYCVKAFGTETFNGDGLFLKGSYLGNWNANGVYTIKGTAVTVTAPTSAKFGFIPAADVKPVDSLKELYAIDAPFKAAAGTGIYVSRNEAPQTGYEAQVFTLRLLNDCSQFFGDIDLRVGGILSYEGTSSAFPARVSMRGGSELRINAPGARAVALGSVALETGAVLAVSNVANAVSVDTLDYQGGDILLPLDFADGRVATLSAAAFAKPAAKIRITLFGSTATPEGAAGVTFQPFLKVPAASGLAPDDIELVAENRGFAGLPTFTVSCADDGDGMRSFSPVARPVVTLKTTDGSGQSCLSTVGTRSGDNAHWSDGQYPHADADYLVPNGMTVRTSSNVNLTTPFAGNSLVLAGGTLAFKGPITAARIVTMKPTTTSGNPTLSIMGALTNRVSGGVIDIRGYTVFSGVTHTDKWTPQYGATKGGWPEVIEPRYAYVDSELVGSGETSWRVARDSADEPFQRPAYFELTRLNTNYFGKLTLTSTMPYATRTNADAAAVLVVSDARNLGGRLPASTFGAVTINEYAGLWFKDDVTNDDPNRGIDVTFGARFIVNEGKTFTHLGQLTLRGDLRKEGPGALALGGPVTFATSGSATPLPGTNVLTVAEGAVKAVTTNGYDGVRIVFKAGTRLVVDAAAANEPLRQYGLYDVKLAAGDVSPFDLSDCGGKLAVGIEGDVGAAVREIALFTVARDVPDLADAIVLSQPRSDRVAVISRRVNADSTVTYLARFQSGLQILFR